ncbi:MAG: sulfate permease [Gammaproteobacteria bacterium]|nr:sulfate permease [Gammaproteobacteria bacterium]
MKLRNYFPILTWSRSYDLRTGIDDLIAAFIVTILLIPQALSYALLAGMPAVTGLYASIAPLLIYALFGSSRVLVVGPAAVVSLMTASAIGDVLQPGTPGYIAAALALAVMSGMILLLMGIFRLGFLANFISHPVVTGFMSASALLIGAGQLPSLLGLSVTGTDFVSLANGVLHAGPPNPVTMMLGVGAMLLMVFMRYGARLIARVLRLSRGAVSLLVKLGPVLAVVVTTLLVSWLGLEVQGVAIVGAVPTGLPSLQPLPVDVAVYRDLAGSAVLIGVIGFVGSISMAQTLAARKRQRIDPNQELIGLGAANIASGFTGGFPISGGFARSVVNYDVGARTPAAGAMTAVGLAIVSFYLTPWLYYLPKATLAATIIVAASSLIEPAAFRQTWRFSKPDFTAMVATAVGTLALGVELGIAVGVALSLLLLLYRTSRPHCAVVGQVPGSEEFKNIARHDVITHPHIITLRMDESLYFTNARFIEDRVSALVAERPQVEHFVLMCTAVNDIDASGLDSLEAINERLRDANVTFHLSAVKGPVMDKLERTDFLRHLTGQVFFSQYEAVQSLTQSAD